MYENVSFGSQHFRISQLRQVIDNMGALFCCIGGRQALHRAALPDVAEKDFLHKDVLRQYDLIGKPIPEAAWRAILRYVCDDAKFMHFITSKVCILLSKTSFGEARVQEVTCAALR